MNPCERVVRTTFEGDRALYRSFEGHRVVADFQGSGIIHLERCESAFTLITDGNSSPEFPGEFTDHAIVLVHGPGRTDFIVRSPRGTQSSDNIQDDASLTNGANTGASESTGTWQHCGIGWVIHSDTPFCLDGRHLWEIPGNQPLPVPFFRSVETRGRLTIRSAGQKGAQCVDRIDVGAPESLRSHAWTVRNMSQIRNLSSQFSDGAPHVAATAVHLNAATWKFECPERHGGLILRRTFDRFHGRQRARVFIDGELAGWWYDPTEDRESRWQMSDFGLPLALTAGKQSIDVTIDPPAGATLWSFSSTELWAFG